MTAKRNWNNTLLYIRGWLHQSFMRDILHVKELLRESLTTGIANNTLFVPNMTERELTKSVGKSYRNNSKLRPGRQKMILSWKRKSLTVNITLKLGKGTIRENWCSNSNAINQAFLNLMTLEAYKVAAREPRAGRTWRRLCWISRRTREHPSKRRDNFRS